VWSSVGSTNLDWRSFLHNDEINASVVGREFAAQMQSMFNDDLAASDPIDPQQWPHRSLWLKLKEIGARVWEYWL
jgi:cardiolipin synthase